MHSYSTCTYMVKKCCPYVVQMTKKCEQTFLLFVIPNLHKQNERKYIKINFNKVTNKSFQMFEMEINIILQMASWHTFIL